MGRMKRQRRYKACDPFSRAKKDTSKESKYDQAPKNLDDDQVPRKFKQVQKGIENPNMKRKKKNTKLEQFEKNNALKKSVKISKAANEEKTANMEKLPNETRLQYFDRLDQNVQEAITGTMMEAKKLRKKRKEHLKARSEKLKLKKNKPTESDFNTVKKDHVEFGERVDAPPTITAAPRKATQNSKKYQNLKLASLMQKKQKKEPDADDLARKEVLEEERQRVIDAYRLLKKRKEVRLNT